MPASMEAAKEAAKSCLEDGMKAAQEHFAASPYIAGGVVLGIVLVCCCCCYRFCCYTRERKTATIQAVMPQKMGGYRRRPRIDDDDNDRTELQCGDPEFEVSDVVDVDLESLSDLRTAKRTTPRRPGSRRSKR